MLLFAVAVAVSLLFSFVCSLCEATILSVSAARVERLAQAGSRAAGPRLARAQVCGPPSVPL